MMSNTTYPILYSFRRCPYAIRARLALRYSGQTVELREVVLKDKPQNMLAVSEKGTVPVLVLQTEKGEQKVLDESLDIMLWSLKRSDPEQWLPENNTEYESQLALIHHNDSVFKQNLDRYKYHDRYPEHSAEYYRSLGEAFLSDLETKLATQDYLFGDRKTLADMAIFPFVRQFAHVDKAWFDQSPYPRLITWLEHLLASESFNAIMPKFSQWQVGDEPIYF